MAVGIGIGAAIVEGFVKEGTKVVVADTVVESGEQTVKMVEEASGEAIFVKTDVSKAEDIQDMIERTVDTYGKLDVLYNNAGIVEMAIAKIADCTEEH